MSKAFSSRWINETLKRCKNGPHEDKVGRKVKRARQASIFRKEFKNFRFESEIC